MNKLAILSLCALLGLVTLPTGSSLDFAPAPALPVAADASAVAVGTMEYYFCSDPDVVVFGALDNGDGTWTFTFVDVGNPCSPWAETGTNIVSAGSPETGFSGARLSSGPWTVNADGSFTGVIDALVLDISTTSTLSGPIAGQLA